VLLSVAELERQLIRRRTSKGRRRRVEGGKWNGGYAPYGYDYAPAKGKLCINEAEAEVVRRIYRLYSGGVSMHETARQLNTEGVPTKRGGKGWWRVQLWWLLKNPAYKGE